MAEILEKVPVQLVEKISFLKGLTPHDVTDLTNHLSLKKFNKDSYVFKEGDMANEMFFILQGSVKVFKKTFRGAENYITDLSQNQFFGDSALIDRSNRAASILVSSDLIVASLSFDDFQDLISKNPTVALYIVNEIAKAYSLRLRKANAIYVNIPEQILCD